MRCAKPFDDSRSCQRRGSPISTGLFFVRRQRIWMTRSNFALAANEWVELAFERRLRKVRG